MSRGFLLAILWMVLAASPSVVLAPARTFLPGDRLRIVCPKLPWLTLECTVDENGRIQLPTIGAVPIATQTSAEAGETISARVSDSLGTPRVPVEVVSVSTREGTVRITGAVLHPLELRFRTGVELARLLELAQPSENADTDHLDLSRGDGSSETVGADDRVRLSGGDRVVVPVRSGRSDVQVIGGVVDPTSVRFRKGMTLAMAIAAAGGVAARGDATKIVVIRHGEPLPLSLPEDAEFMIQAGESVQVTVRSDRRFVVVKGAVVRPGLVEYSPGMTLSQAVAAAGGPLPSSNGNATLKSGIGKGKRNQVLSLAFINALRIPDPILQPDDLIELLAATGGRG